PCMEQNSGVDTPSPASEPREADAERDQEGQRLDEAVGEAEENADGYDRERPSPALEQAVAEAAEGQLLDDRREAGDDDEVDGEGGGAMRVPARGCEALLAASVQDRVERVAQDLDADEHDERSADREPPAGRPAEGKQLARVHGGDGEDEREDDPVLDEAAD